MRGKFVIIESVSRSLGCVVTYGMGYFVGFYYHGAIFGGVSTLGYISYSSLLSQLNDFIFEPDLGTFYFIAS